MVVSDFAVREAGDGVWLATYALRQGDRDSRRLSVWRRTGDDWDLLYHQGTVVPPSSQGSRGVVVGEPPVVLSDGVVTLRAWEPDDAQAVFEACQDPITSFFLRLPLPYTEEVARQFIVRRQADWDSDHERSFAITDATSGGILGSIARHGPWDHRAQFGYWLAPWARGRGSATRALRLITDWTWVTTDACRLELYTDPMNHASGRVAERAGYVREGLRRAWDVDRDGGPLDVVFYVIVRGDPPPA